MLEDPHRMDAYERAIRRLVKPGDIVLDLGAGTGILAMLAARRGARRVHAVESMAVAGLCRQLVAANGLEDVICVHRADITRMAPVEKVDLVVSDFLGRFVTDDGMFDAVRAAGAWLRPGGRFCPSRVELFLAPVGDIRIGAIDLFHEPFYGLDLSLAQVYARNMGYHTELEPNVLAGPPVFYHALEPPDLGGVLDHKVELPIVGNTRLRAFVGWFQAELADGVELSTEPGVQTHWGQYLFPLPDIAASAGDHLELRLWMEESDGQEDWRWEGSLARSDGSEVSFCGESVQRLGERRRE